jgi:hypothetical protein
LLPSGALDLGFNDTGQRVFDLGSNANAKGLANQANGRILVTGNVGSPGDLMLFRINGDGSVDPTYHGGQPVRIDFGASEDGGALALQSDGNALVAGTTSTAPSQSQFAIARVQGEPPSSGGGGSGGSGGGGSGGSGAGGSGGGAKKATPILKLSLVSPSHLGTRHQITIVFHVSHNRHSVKGATVSFAGQSNTTGRNGNASFSVHLHHHKTYHAKASYPGARSATITIHP